MKKYHKLIVVLGIIAFFLCQSCNNKNTIILDENFDENTLGWPEENTSSHNLSIRDGKYSIKAIDTSIYQTSSNSLENSYLRNLPDKYVISTSLLLMDRKGGDSDETNFGLILNSSTLEYRFSIRWDGFIEVTEFDDNKEWGKIIFEKQLENLKSLTLLDLKINGVNFNFFIDGKSVGEGIFKTNPKFWKHLRLYTTTGSAILVDYLKISSNS